MEKFKFEDAFTGLRQEGLRESLSISEDRADHLKNYLQLSIAHSKILKHNNLADILCQWDKDAFPLTLGEMLFVILTLENMMNSSKIDNIMEQVGNAMSQILSKVVGNKEADNALNSLMSELKLKVRKEDDDDEES